MQLLYQTSNQQTPVTARVVPGRDQGQGVAHLVIHSPDHRPWFCFSAPVTDLVATLRDLLHQAEAIQTGGNPLSELSPPSLTPETQQPPTRKIVLGDLNGDPRHDWPLFVARFHDTDAKDTLAAIAELYKKNYGYRPPDIDTVLDAQERLELDFEVVKPYLPDIIDSDGTLKRGARARIAEALEIKDAGNYRSRIDAILGFISNADPVELLGNWAAKSNNSNPVSMPRAVNE